MLSATRHPLRGDGDRKRQDAGVPPRRLHGRRLRGGRRERDPAVPTAGARGLGRGAGAIRRAHQPRQLRGHQRQVERGAEALEESRRALDRSEQRARVAALDRGGRVDGGAP